LVALGAISISGLASAQDEAPPDTSRAERKLISTDGAVSAYEEATPGEGIEGFWWEYDAQKDLTRLLDDDLRTKLLDPIVDAFGFALAVPESIRALRDSVTAVADSILAEIIKLETSFNPKFSSTYNELRDTYNLKHSFDTSIPLTERGTVIASVKNESTFNEATKSSTDSRTLQSTFNFKFRDDLVTSLSMTRTDDLQELAGATVTESDNTSANATMRSMRDLGSFKIEGDAGLGWNERTYFTATTDGRNTAVTPSWGAKISRAHDGGNVALDYSGNFGISTRKETLPDSTVESDERNDSNKLGVALTHQLSEGNDFKIDADFSRSSLQYFSQAESLRGIQETRVTETQGVRLNVNASPATILSIRANGEVSRNQSLYERQDELSTISTVVKGHGEIEWSPWSGGKLTAKLDGSREDRDRTPVQSGLVENQTGSIDYKQDITDKIEFTATYFITLDSFKFDLPDSNRGDRDLLNRRSTFIVRYNPTVGFTTSVRMEIRGNESVNIHRSRSGDNKTDYSYIITPDYTWKVGPATLTGEVSADVRYAVFDIREENNDVVRRFSTRQKWQHSFSTRVSTSLLLTYEFNDQGGYRRSVADGLRRFSKSREVRRTVIDTQVLYKPIPGFETTVTYRRNADDTYSVDGDERTLSDERRTYELSWGVNGVRNLTKHVNLSLRFAQTHKRGDQVQELEKKFYSILATVEYQPLKKKKEQSSG
jgi:hypothetical protein